MGEGWDFAVEVVDAYVSSERGFCISSWIFASGAPEAIVAVVWNEFEWLVEWVSGCRYAEVLRQTVDVKL